MTIAIYAGSFDPFTLGHAAIAGQALKVFGKVMIAAGRNGTKEPMFPDGSRTGMALRTMGSLGHTEGVIVTSFEGLLVDFAKEVRESSDESVVIVRGLRAVSDFESEMTIATVNHRLNQSIPTVFIPTHAGISFVSSSMVKEIARNTTDEKHLRQFVSEEVAQALIARSKRRG